MNYMDTDISCENVLVGLELQKKIIHQSSLLLEKLIQLINTISQKITQTEFDTTSELQALYKERDALITRTDVTHTQVALALAELEKTVADKKNMHNATMSNLEGQILELQNEYFTKYKRMESTMEEMKTQQNFVIEKLKEKMLSASPTEVKIIQKKITELEIVFEMDFGNLKRLQQQFCKNIDIEKKEKLQNSNMCITSSGNFFTSSGRRLSWSEISCIHTKQSQVFDDSISNTSESSSLFSSESRLTTEDMQYLRNIFEKPLSLALTELLAKQPKDPIHYLGHWLFKYRYNQDVDIVKIRELEALRNEKDLLEKEKLNMLLLSEARNVLMNLIAQAEEEAIRKELERIGRETAAMEMGE